MSRIRYYLRKAAKFLTGEFGDRTINIGNIKLTINLTDAGGSKYLSDEYIYDQLDKLHQEIEEIFHPQLVIDIGANYGYTGAVYSKIFPSAKLILIEPSPALEHYIKTNMSQNNVPEWILKSSICSDEDNNDAIFHLNPTSSQDNRVLAESGEWKPQRTNAVTISHLLSSHDDQKFVFIKIDTQGFEQRVFNGGRSFFSRSNNWIVKTEFAPYWLRSQNTDPASFIEHLTKNYCVAEFPLRPLFKGNTLTDLALKKIMPEDSNKFSEYVSSRAKDGKGWCDLLVWPRALEKQFLRNN